jgi:hypothetical protein
MGRAERRRFERELTPSLAPALFDPADWPLDDGLAWQVPSVTTALTSDPSEPQ